MEKSFSKNFKLRFEERLFNLRVIPTIKIGFGFHKIDRPQLSDFSYGEFLIYENSIPSFYYSAFNDDGSLNNIAIYAKQHNLELDKWLIELLKNNGFAAANIPRNEFISIEQDSKSYMKEYRLKVILEYIES